MLFFRSNQCRERGTIASYEFCRKGEMSHSDTQHQIKILKILHDVLGLFSLRS